MDNKNENGEIDLREYLKIIYKNRKLIFGVFLAAVVIVGLRDILSPKIYALNAWLEIGKTIEGATINLIETPAQISQKIKNNIYGDFPYNAVISNPEETNLVSMAIKSAEPDKAKKDLEKLCETILMEHAEKIKIKKNALESEIKRLQESIGLLKDEKKNLAANIELPFSGIDLAFAKDILLGKSREIEDAYTKMESLKNSMGNIYDSRIIKEITISEESKKSKIFKDIVFAGALGLFLGVAIVFWKKWWMSFK